MSPTFRAFKVRNFRLYASGAIISNVGTWMQRVAQDWLVLELTHSGTALGIVTGLQFLPALLLGPYAAPPRRAAAVSWRLPPVVRRRRGIPDGCQRFSLAKVMS